MTVLLSCKARNKDQVSVAVSVQVCVSMREVDKKAIGDAIGAVIKSIRAVGGGDDSETFTMETEGGERFFVKVNRSSEGADKFDAEMQGLDSLRETKGFRVPCSIAIAPLGQPGRRKGAALIMEYINLCSATSETQRKFGEHLARMHLAPAGKRFGYHRDNWCGATPQVNEWCDDWVDFYAKHRLQKQASMIVSRHKDKELGSAIDKLCGVMRERFFKGVEVRPSLLHGDLWSGNWAADDNGQPVLYDPACYIGHSEAELSIMTMFGSPSRGFFEEYHKLLPRHEDGFEERQLLYQLYHYMNHYNLFGSGYRGACKSILSQLLK